MRFFLLQNHLDRLWGPLNLLLKEYLDPFEELKQPGHDTDHSPEELYIYVPYTPSWCGQEQLHLFNFFSSFRAAIL
jgi:hypothetical protein